MFRQLSLKQNQLEQEALFEAFDEMESDWVHTTIIQIPLGTEVEMLEKDRIVTALAMYSGNRTKTANHLGIGRTLLIHKLKKYNLV